MVWDMVGFKICLKYGVRGKSQGPFCNFMSEQMERWSWKDSSRQDFGLGTLYLKIY